MEKEDAERERKNKGKREALARENGEEEGERGIVDD